jgi:photosystem II stability/assembly factor-like uncharacterized protein
VVSSNKKTDLVKGKSKTAMPPIPPSTSPSKSETAGHTKEKSSGQTRIVRTLVIGLLIISIVVAWQVLSTYNNSTDPTVAGRPLSNAHTHLHTVVLGERPGVLYLGTHYGLFTSTDYGHTWSQPHGVLNTYMVTAIAASPSQSNVLALIVIPTSGIVLQSGIAFSRDGGNTWHISVPPGLSPSAYPFTITAGSGSSGQFYAYYFNAGWFETRDLGAHWYPITSGAFSNMGTSTLLTDPTDPNHLFLGGDQGLFESRDDGSHWLRIAAIQGTVQSIVAANTTPRILFCATDQGLYTWHEGGKLITRISNLPMPIPPTRLAIDQSGKTLYGLSGQDLWYSFDGGTTWVHRWHFDRGDLISLVVDPLHPHNLYAGFFLPPKVIDSTDGGSSWQTLTD